jgi:two-component system chemotaxis response regulator CheB
VTSSAAFDVVAVACSAGGFSALGSLLEALPEDMPVPIVVVQHLDRRHRSVMAELLSRRTKLRVMEARKGDKIAAGSVYIAPPDRHLLIGRGGVVDLTDTELVHFVRPSADLLFESVAATYGDRAIAVVLTGTGTDGAMGTTAIKKRNGTVIVQSEASAQFFGMPSAAIDSGSVDFVLSLEEMPGAIAALLDAEEI